ncbi:MAG: GH3 auxin-responsive promoter family protein [Deltaproteobacteria bacterium]|nr:GH3 auxin-responsive promoter family protein [Deltaproteobacteria bacterium]
MSWSQLQSLSSMPPGWELPLLDERGPGAYRLLRGGQGARVRALLDAALRPEQAQIKALARVLDAARGTELGARYRLDRVRTLRAFRAAVPVRLSAEHQADLDRVAAGEQGVLTRHKVRALVKTSGTTGAPKLLPVTAPWAGLVADAQALWVLGMVREQGALATGKVLTTVGRAVEGHSAGGLPYGSNTGRMQGAQPWWVRLRYAVPAEVFELEDPELRHYVFLRLALAADVRSWTTANPSTLLAMARVAERWNEALRADLSDGTLSHGPAAGRDLRRFRWRLGRKRALPEGFRLGEAWNLAAVNCWKGGAAPYFLRMLPQALGAEPVVREAGISASEGYFGIPLHSSWAGGVAWTGGHLLEFLPLDGGEARWAHEVEVGSEYRLVFSTTAGLYRYDIQDVVKVVGWYGRAPLLVFSRKDRDVLSVTGEKLTAAQVLEAVGQVLRPAPVGAALGVRMAERPVYRFVIEGSPREGVAAALDGALQRLNGEYASKRRTDRLAPPEVRWVAEGTFARHRAMAHARGVALGQYKDPVLLHGADLDDLEALG